MIVEIGDQLLDHHTKPGQLIAAKPLRFAKLARGVGRFGDRAHAAEAAGQLIHLFRGGLDYAFIPAPRAHRERGVLSDLRLRRHRILVSARSLESADL